MVAHVKEQLWEKVLMAVPQERFVIGQIVSKDSACLAVSTDDWG